MVWLNRDMPWLIGSPHYSAWDNAACCLSWPPWGWLRCPIGRPSSFPHTASLQFLLFRRLAAILMGSSLKTRCRLQWLS